MIKMGKHVWLLLLVGICTSVSARPSVVNIGAIFPFNSTIGKVARVAILAAQNDVNSNPHVLGGTNLNISVRDSEYSGFLSVIQGLKQNGSFDFLRFLFVVELLKVAYHIPLGGLSAPLKSRVSSATSSLSTGTGLMESEVVAIIGPQSSVIAHVLSKICDELQVPLLSFASTDPTLSSLQHSFFVRTTQNDLFQMAAIADMIDYFGWREVVALYIDDDYGRNGIAALAEKLAEKRCTISYKAAMNPDVRKEYITDVLAKVALSESRIMVLHTYNSYGLQVLDVAHFLGMMEKGYVWFATNWLTDILDTNSPLSRGDTEHIQGVITLRMHTANTQLKKEFISRWRNLTRMESAKGAFGLNTFGLYAYDTVWLLAHALEKYLDQGGNLSFSADPKLRPLQESKLNLGTLRVFDGGNELLESIMKTNMSGLTGLVKFNQDGNLIHPAFEIINVIGTGYRRVGYWSNHSGLSFHAPENLSKSDQKLYPVIWPGQMTEKPRGWVFSSNGRQMRIGVPNRVSYLEFISYSPSTGTFSGYCIDVFLAAVDLLPYALPFELIPFGDGHNNPSCTELIESMNAGNYDASIGDIAVTTNRTKMADFTQPYIESGLVVLAPLRASESNAWAFLRPFTLKMWCATVIAFLVVGAVVWILEHRINDYFRGPPHNQVVTMLSFSLSTLFFTHKSTLSTLGKMVLIIWLFAVLIIKSTYTASLTSVLTVQQLSSPVKGIESLMQDNDPIGYQKGSFVRNYLTEQLNIHESRLIALNSADEYARAMNRGPKNGGVAAVVDERAYTELFLSTRCEFTTVGQTFTKTGWGFAFPRDSPLAVDMSTALLKLSENGDLQRIHDKWLTRSSCSSRGSKLSMGYLELKSFWGLFALSGLACFLALLAYMYLMVKQFVKHNNEEGERSQRHSPSRRLSRFLSFVDEKEKNSKDSPCERNSSGPQLEAVPEILQSQSGV